VRRSNRLVHLVDFLVLSLLQTMTSSLLPPELWVTIFRWATYTPSMDTSPLDPFDNNLRSWSKLSSEDNPCTSTIKSTLVLVCKSWHRLASRIQIESIERLPNDRWPAFAAYVRKFQHMYPDQDSLYLAVRRITLGNSPPYENEEMSRPFAASFAQFKNLEIISIRDFAPLLLLTYGNQSCTLRHINLDFEYPSIFTPLLQYLAVLPNLRVLTIHIKNAFPFSRTFSPLAESQNVHLPHLHTLELDSFDALPLLSFVMGWEMPALHSLSLYHMGDLPLESTPFFQCYGSSLTYFGFDQWMGSSGHLIELLKYCPLLQHLSLPHLGIRNWDFSNPELKRMSIPALDWVRCQEVGEPIRIHPDMPEAFMLELPRRMKPKGLESFRLISWSAENYKRKWVLDSLKRFQSIIEAYREAGVRLENDDRSLVVLPANVWEETLVEYTPR
jgi:hypothetical protein